MGFRSGFSVYGVEWTEALGFGVSFFFGVFFVIVEVNGIEKIYIKKKKD